MSFINNYGKNFLVTKTIAMPNNLNQDGDVFGGWILSIMDTASVIATAEVCSSRVVTRAVNSVVFDKPIMLGDELSFYATIDSIGNTSINITIEVFAKMRGHESRKAVTGKFTMVAIDENRKPLPIISNLNPMNSNVRKAEK